MFRISNFGFRVYARYASQFTLHENEIHSTKYYIRNYQKIMQNKPNLLDAQMNISSLIRMCYENISDWTLGENKPNQTQNKPNLTQLKPISMPIKPNSNPNKACPERSRMGQFRNHTTTSKERKEKRISGTFSGSQLPERI